MYVCVLCACYVSSVLNSVLNIANKNDTRDAVNKAEIMF